MTPERDECGAATLLAVTLSGLLVVLGVALAAVVGLVADHRRAAAAADLAALAGATALATGGGDSCEAARVVAEANGARLTSCVAVGSDVSVRTTVDVDGWRGLVAQVEGQARAGPGGQPALRPGARRRACAPRRPSRAWPTAR